MHLYLYGSQYNYKSFSREFIEIPGIAKRWLSDEYSFVNDFKNLSDYKKLAVSNPNIIGFHFGNVLWNQKQITKEVDNKSTSKTSDSISIILLKDPEMIIKGLLIISIIICIMKL